MEQKKSTLKEIKATVMPQTAEGLQMLMEETGLTIGEVIDRLTLQMCPDDLGFAVCFAQDQVFFSISSLPEEEQEEALTKIIIFLAGLVPVDHLKGLEQAAISKRAERLKEYKEYIEDLPEKDTKKILKELAILYILPHSMERKNIRIILALSLFLPLLQEGSLYGIRPF